MRTTQRVGTLRRGLEIASVGARYFLFSSLNRHRKEPLGVRLRLACEELGLTFIKLGQLLSTRYDLLDRADCDELKKLLDEVPPMSNETVRQIFLTDYGKLPEDIYAEFEWRPIAAASIAQVYRATLADGTRVAVKVRRPGIERAIRADVRIFKHLARVARWFQRNLRHIDMDNVLSQLESWLLAEIDFANEVANLREIQAYYHTRLEGSEGNYARRLVFPKPYPAFSGAHVITMDYLEGVPVRQFATLEGNPEYDVRGSLDALMRAVLRAWVTQDTLVFHGDPHPSNLLIMPHGKIGLLDLGLLGRFNRKDVQETRDLFLAVYAQNVEQSAVLGLKMAGASAEFDSPTLRRDLEAYIGKAHFSGLGFWFLGFIRIFLDHKIPLPYQLVLFGRGQTIIDGIFETVLPGTKALDILGEELDRALRRKTLQNLKEITIAPILYAISEKVKKSPEKVAQLVDKYFDNPLELVRDFRDALKV